MSDWQTMRALLEGIPALPGARCKGPLRSVRADRREHRMTGRLTMTELDDARREALWLCVTGCPALVPCQAWLSALPAGQRPAASSPAGSCAETGASSQPRPRAGDPLPPPEAPLMALAKPPGFQKKQNERTRN